MTQTFQTLIYHQWKGLDRKMQPECREAVMPQSNDLLNATVLIVGQNRFHVWLSSDGKAYSHGLQVPGRVYVREGDVSAEYGCGGKEGRSKLYHSAQPLIVSDWMTQYFPYLSVHKHLLTDNESFCGEEQQ